MLSKLAWWVCFCQSQFDFNARKSPSSIFLLFPLSSFLLFSMFKSVWLDAFMSGLSSILPQKILSIRILDYTARSTPWWPSDQSHGHLISRHCHTIHRCQSQFMDSTFDGPSNVTNLFPDSVANISSNDLITTHNIVAECYTTVIANKTIILHSYCLDLSYTCLLTTTDNRIMKWLIQLTEKPFALMFLFASGNHYSNKKWKDS